MHCSAFHINTQHTACSERLVGKVRSMQRWVSIGMKPSAFLNIQTCHQYGWDEIRYHFPYDSKM